MEPRSRAMVYQPMTGPLALLLLSGCAARIPHGLRETELRWVERALEQGDAATANQALVGLAVLGEDALPLLPMVLARADRGDLDPDQLADAFEAMGPRAVATLEPRAMVAWASHVQTWLQGAKLRSPAILSACPTTLPARGTPRWRCWPRGLGRRRRPSSRSSPRSIHRLR